MTPTTQPVGKLLRRSCRETAALLVAREDRALGLPDKVAVKLHLLVCKACPKFENQLIALRTVMGHWRNYSGDDDKP